MSTVVLITQGAGGNRGTVRHLKIPTPVSTNARMYEVAKRTDTSIAPTLRFVYIVEAVCCQSGVRKSGQTLQPGRANQKMGHVKRMAWRSSDLAVLGLVELGSHPQSSTSPSSVETHRT